MIISSVSRILNLITLTKSFLPYKGIFVDFPGGTSGKEPSCQWRKRKRRGFDLWVGKIPWRRTWQLTPLFLPGESPWTEEPGRPQSLGSQRVRQNWSNLSSMHARWYSQVPEIKTWVSLGEPLSSLLYWYLYLRNQRIYFPSCMGIVCLSFCLCVCLSLILLLSFSNRGPTYLIIYVKWFDQTRVLFLLYLLKD